MQEVTEAILHFTEFHSEAFPRMKKDHEDQNFKLKSEALHKPIAQALTLSPSHASGGDGTMTRSSRTRPTTSIEVESLEQLLLNLLLC